MFFYVTTKDLKKSDLEKGWSFTESVIREMSREAVKYGAVNLGQGFPDWAAPEDIKQKLLKRSPPIISIRGHLGVKVFAMRSPRRPNGSLG